MATHILPALRDWCVTAVTSISPEIGELKSRQTLDIKNSYISLDLFENCFLEVTHPDIINFLNDKDPNWIQANECGGYPIEN